MRPSTPSSSSPRLVLVTPLGLISRAARRSLWPVKFLAVPAALIGLLFVSDSWIFGVYAEVARMLSLVYLLFQASMSYAVVASLCRFPWKACVLCRRCEGKNMVLWVMTAVIGGCLVTRMGMGMGMETGCRTPGACCSGKGCQCRRGMACLWCVEGRMWCRSSPFPLAARRDGARASALASASSSSGLGCELSRRALLLSSVTRWVCHN